MLQASVFNVQAICLGNRLGGHFEVTFLDGQLCGRDQGFQVRGVGFQDAIVEALEHDPSVNAVLAKESSRRDQCVRCGVTQLACVQVVLDEGHILSGQIGLGVKVGDFNAKSSQRKTGGIAVDRLFVGGQRFYVVALIKLNADQKFRPAPIPNTSLDLCCRDFAGFGQVASSVSGFDFRIRFCRVADWAPASRYRKAGKKPAKTARKPMRRCKCLLGPGHKDACWGWRDGARRDPPMIPN